MSTKPKAGTVPREFYEEMKGRAVRAEAAIAQYILLYGKLVDQVVEIKRHEQGMHPPGFDPASLDPLNALGPMTKAAIEEHSGGDRELQNYLEQFALREWASRHDVPPDEKDGTIATRIAQGDTE